MANWAKTAADWGEMALPTRTRSRRIGPGLVFWEFPFRPRRQGKPHRWEFELVKLTLRDKETAQEAVRRFRKLVERSGIKKEIRIREFYEKPSETKRRARLRAARRSRRERLMGRQ